MSTTPQTIEGQSQRAPAPFWCLSTLLMAGLAACYGLQYFITVRQEKPYDIYLALSDYGMKSWQLWQLFTCHFLHDGLVHLGVNLLALWFLARSVEGCLGTWKFLKLYAGAALFGALLQGFVALAGVLLPESLNSISLFIHDRYGGPAAGSSIGLCGVLAAFCLMKPETKIKFLFVVPIAPHLLLWLVLGVAACFVVIPSDPGLAHLAHLGGLLAGIALFKLGADRPAQATTPKS
jgi:membrane associated rhomboid family serine protease